VIDCPAGVYRVAYDKNHYHHSDDTAHGKTQQRHIDPHQLPLLSHSKIEFTSLHDLRLQINAWVE
jgi:hypothetical protein